MALDRLLQDGEATLLRYEKAGEKLEQGRLTGAGGADDGEGAVAGDIETDISQGPAATVRERETLDADCRGLWLTAF